MSYKQEVEDRKEMQRILKRTAGYTGRIDGHWGPLMKASMERYMDANDGNQPEVKAQAGAHRTPFKIGLRAHSEGVASEETQSQVAKRGTPFKISAPT